MRLRNLGYSPGARGAEGEGGALDAPTRAAVRSFQRDHAIEETGELDDPTVAALRQAHHA